MGTTIADVMPAGLGDLGRYAKPAELALQPLRLRGLVRDDLNRFGPRWIVQVVDEGLVLQLMLDRSGHETA